MANVLIITGPPGAGKTTITKLVSEQYGYTIINGDKISERLFPDVSLIANYPDKLAVVERELIDEVKKQYDESKNVIVDYVVVEEKYINEFKKIFGDNLTFRILLPKKETVIRRDTSRECGTIGEERVTELHKEFEKLKPILGEECFVNNTHETAEETVAKHFKFRV